MNRKRNKPTPQQPHPGPGGYTHLIDLDSLPSMAELLPETGTGQKPPAASPGPGENGPHKKTSAIAKAGDRLRKAPTGPSARTVGGLNLADLPSMEELLGDRLNPEQIKLSDPLETRPDHRPVKTAADGQLPKNQSRAPRKSRHAPRKRAGSLPGMVVIDGSNICRHENNLDDSAGNPVSSLSLLLKMTLFLIRKNIRFRCLFDASEGFALGRNSRWPLSRTVYLELLRHAPARFSEVPAGQSADEMILRLATEKTCPVISNDRFNKSNDCHLDQYPWLNGTGRRLFRAETDRFGTVYWPDLGLKVRPGGDPRILGSEVLARLPDNDLT